LAGVRQSNGQGPVAVLGAGNGGYAMAADMTRAGYDVIFYEHPRFGEAFAPTLTTRRVALEGALGSYHGKVSRATTDVETVLASAQLVNLVVPSTAQEDFFAEMLPHLGAGHTVVVWAGRFGAPRLAAMLQEQGRRLDFTIAEVNTLPYGVRRPNPHTANILYTAKRMYAAAVPKEETTRVVGELHLMYPQINELDNVLAVALSNPALTVFGIGALLNVARIQYTEGDFYLFKEGITPGVARVIEEAYREMEQVGAAYACSLPQYTREDFAGPLSLEGANFSSPGGPRDFARMDGPSTVRGRYMMENIGDGLVPAAQLGTLAGVPTPVLDALITLGSVVCEEDFRRAGRNLRRLGVEGLTVEGVLRLVERGVRKL